MMGRVDHPGEIVGRRIDRYVVEGQLGAGGFGAVYRARHSVLGTEVALKVLSPQHGGAPEIVERFLREAQLAAGIGNPHIVGVSDAGVTSDGLPFLAMELLEGEDIEGRIARAGALPIPEAIDIGVQLLDGLGAAHAAGIVHRDMKPANVFLVTGPGGRPFVKLLDFGISKVVDPSKVSALTKTGMMLGTPAYMAPEQLQDTRGVDHRADLYASAAILFEMITGRLPYAADSFADLMERVQGREAARLDAYAPQAPPALVELVARGLARDPSARYASASEMSRALSDVRASAFSNVPATTGSPALAATASPGTPSGAPGGYGGGTPAHGGASSGAGPGAPSYGLARPGGAGPGAPSYGLARPGGMASGPPSAPSYGLARPGGMAPGPPSHGAGPPGMGPGYGPPPSWGATAPPARKRSTGLWIGVGAVGLLASLGCLVGGAFAFGPFGDEPTPHAGMAAPVAPVAPTVQPSAPRPAPPTPSPTPSPTPAPPAPTPTPAPSSGPPPIEAGPPTPVSLPDGVEPCAVPVVHQVQCDRDWDDHIPPECEVRRGRELHVLAAYGPGSDDGVVTVDLARTAAPIVLVLSSYGDTTWRLRLAEGVELEEVVLVGRGRSEVEGAPDGARVRTRTSRSPSAPFPGMGWSWDGMTDRWSGRRTSEAAEDSTRLALRAYAGCYGPTRFILGQGAP